MLLKTLYLKRDNISRKYRSLSRSSRSPSNPSILWGNKSLIISSPFSFFFESEKNPYFFFFFFFKSIVSCWMNWYRGGNKQANKGGTLTSGNSNHDFRTKNNQGKSVFKRWNKSFSSEIFCLKKINQISKAQNLRLCKIRTGLRWNPGLAEILHVDIL